MNQKFNYLKKGEQSFPVVDVELKRGKRELKLKALVDSGASFSVFRSEIADYLGINLEKGSPIYLTGIGGRILGYLHRVPIKVNRKKFTCKIIFSEEFTVSLNILGRDNFFFPFLVIFNEKDKEVTLKG